MNTPRTRSLCLALSLALAAGCSGADGIDTSAEAISVVGPNLLANGAVETVAAGGPVSDMTTAQSGVAGASSAAGWRTFVNTPGSIHTDMLATTRPGAVGNMIHVVTDGTNNGLFQAWDSFHRGAASTFMYAWVYVVSGAVGIGSGDGGSTGMTRTTNVTGQWIRLDGPNGNAPSNSFLVDSFGGPAEFYVDSAGVSTSNLVANSDFETPGPQPSPVWVVTPPGQSWVGGNSAAQGWGVWMNAPGRTMTELLPSSCPAGQGGGRMIHVVTGASNSGLQQAFHAVTPTSLGVTRTSTTVWVYVRSGRVGIGAGDQGNTSLTAITAPGQLNAWVPLTTANGNAPSNLVVVDSYGGGADYFVDAASVVAVP